MSVFRQYLAHIDEVKGWLDNDAAVISNRLMAWQSRNNISGNVCEIGVHHGRYFIALAAGLLPGEFGLAVDLFGNQAENVDGSGAGDARIFSQNVARFVPDVSVTVITGNSLGVRPSEITARGPVRFFSVDGGHTAEAALNDLRLAAASILPEGIVALDDILNHHWTGVLSAAAEYLQTDPQLVPFSLVPNKLLLCRPGHATRYRTILTDAFPGRWLTRECIFLGFPVEVFAGAAQSDGELASIKASRRYRWASAIADGVNRLLRR